MANTVHGPFVKGGSTTGAYSASGSYTSGNANNGETQSAVALASFNPDLIGAGVVLSGVIASKDATTASQLDVTAGHAYLIVTDGTNARIDVASTTFSTSGHPSTTLYLDLNPDGTWNWATTHSAQANYLTICQVTTDGSSNISSVTDARPTSVSLLAGLVGATVASPAFSSVSVNSPQPGARPLTLIGGVTQGTAGLIRGDSDKAMTFNGSTGLLESLDATGLPTGAGAVTLECWAQMSAYPSGANGIVFEIGDFGANKTLWLIIDTAGHVSAGVDNQSTANSAAVALNTPHHLVATYDGTNIRCYVDGALTGGPTAATQAVSYANGIAFTLGANTFSTPGNFFSGVIDEAAIYGVALSAARVSTHYSVGAAGSATTTYAATVLSDSPLRYHRLGDTSGRGVAQALAASNPVLAADGSVAPTYISSIGGQATTGSFGAPVIVAQALNVAVITTGDHTILTYTPTASGLYRVSGYFEMNGTLSGGVIARFTYGDDLGTPTAYMSLDAVGTTNPILLNGATTIGAAQSGPLSPVTVYAKTGTNIICHYNSPNGTPNDHVWYLIERLA